MYQRSQTVTITMIYRIVGGSGEVGKWGSPLFLLHHHRALGWALLTDLDKGVK